MSSSLCSDQDNTGVDNQVLHQHQVKVTDAPNNISAAHKRPSPTVKKKRLPGTPDPNAEVIALSPTTLMATNRFVCEICSKGFQRDQNLQLHRRGHNLPWKLKQRSSTGVDARKRVYVCPVKTCVHNNPSRALGDLTGMKKHFCRKHGEKKWKCDKCSKMYAVQSDWKAHSKTCGAKEYTCYCGTVFSRRDTFVTHRTFCDDDLTEDNKNRGHSLAAGATTDFTTPLNFSHETKNRTIPMSPCSPDINTLGSLLSSTNAGTLLSPQAANFSPALSLPQLDGRSSLIGFDGLSTGVGSGQMMPATALLAQMGATTSNITNSSSIGSCITSRGFPSGQPQLFRMDGRGIAGQFFSTNSADNGVFSSTAAAVCAESGITAINLTHTRAVEPGAGTPRFIGGNMELARPNTITSSGSYCVEFGFPHILWPSADGS